MILPFAIAVPANLGVDHVKAGAAREIFQVLWPQVSPSPVRSPAYAAQEWSRNIGVTCHPEPDRYQTCLKIEMPQGGGLLQR